MYGIDIFGKGIQAARENTSLTDIRVNYINRDFFDFTHDYPFNELITNMPRVMGQKEKKDIIQIYQKFWKKAKEHVKVNGILVILSYDKDILKQTLRNEWYTILKEYEISKKEGAYGFIIELNSQINEDKYTQIVKNPLYNVDKMSNYGDSIHIRWKKCG